MSWSFAAIGTPDKVKEALRKSLAGYAPTAGGSPSQSYLEFAEAAVHLEGLLNQGY